MSKISQKQTLRRSAIIEKAIPLLNAMDFDDISVHDICRAAEISVGSFYHYFNKKADLLVGLLGLIDEYMEAEAFPRLGQTSAVDDLRLFAHHWALHVHNNGLERSKLVSSVLPANTDHSGMKRSSIVKLEEIIARGQANGEIVDEPDAAVLTEYFLLALRGVTTDWSRQNGSYSVVDKMDEYIAFWLKAIRNEGKEQRHEH